VIDTGVIFSSKTAQRARRVAAPYDRRGPGLGMKTARATTLRRGNGMRAGSLQQRAARHRDDRKISSMPNRSRIGTLGFLSVGGELDFT
jgi:hypothetical protein